MLDPLDYENRPYLSALEKKRRKAFRVLTLESFIIHTWRLFFWCLMFGGLWMLSLPSFFGTIASIATTIIFFGGVLYLIKTDILRFTLPDKKGLDNRIEKYSSMPQGQIALIEDRLANPKKHDTRDLWSAAQHKSLLSFTKLKSPKAKSLLSREDPSAIRYIAILLFVSGFMVSGPLWKEKIYSGILPFSPSYVVSQGKVTNIWIKPPDYTQIPQMHLSGHDQHNEQISIPEDSEIRIRIHSAFGEYFPPYLKNGNQKERLTYLGDGLYGIETIIRNGESLSISQGFIPRASWDYNFIKDRPPTIKSDITSTTAINKDVIRIEDELPPLPLDDEKSETAPDDDSDTENADSQTNAADPPATEITNQQRFEILENDQIRFPLIVQDDYGVKELRMTMDIDDMVIEKPLGEKTDETRLVMSQPDKEFKITPIYNMTWHTWAGLPVTFTYEAIDHKGQIAVLDKINVVLPERQFEHPMAKSLIAMRKRLAWEYKNSFAEIAQNLDSLLNAQDYMQNDPIIYLAIKVSSARLFFNDSKPQEIRIQAAKDVINLLWYTALAIEDGDVTLAMRELQDAQRALENAMRDPNTSDEEIQELMDNLQDKMANYFREMQREMQKRMENGENFPTFSAEDYGELISPDTLSKMMEDIQKALREGDEQKAQELMSQMQRMMEMMDPSNGMQLPGDMQMMQQGVNELQELIERQESLLEQTEEQAKLQEKLGKPSARQNNQARSGSNNTVTPRSLPTLEKMLKDFGMDTLPPPPKDETEENSPKTEAENNTQSGEDSASEESESAGQNQSKEQSTSDAQNKNQGPGDTPQALDTTQNKAEQDALRYVLGQLMMDAAEKLDEVPEKMGMAEQEMRQSADALGENDPIGSGPHQELAIKYLKDAQEELAQQFRQRMKQMVGIGMSGSGQQYDPLGRRYDEDENGRGTDSKVEVPDELDKKRVDEIINELRDRSGDRSRPQEELEYLRRLLRQF
ncbi:MAG: DUF4175 domain-containing protein [Alcanivorax sp.]